MKNTPTKAHSFSDSLAMILITTTQTPVEISFQFWWYKNSWLHQSKDPTQKEGTKVCVYVRVCAFVYVALQSITEITLAWESAPRQETAI